MTNNTAKPIDQLMQREVTRAEFLATLGFGAISILGFGRIVEMLTGHSAHKNLSNHPELGYSNGDYGGSKTNKPVAAQPTKRLA